ncbi:hypothetical protein [Streptomyces coeruleorubidus]|uniref:hypothetical protein n=1 Tax=Streptomyces coeruleorubidus TaxID=116188 RepID=UPI00364CFC1B
MPDSAAVSTAFGSSRASSPAPVLGAFAAESAGAVQVGEHCGGEGIARSGRVDDPDRRADT